MAEEKGGGGFFISGLISILISMVVGVGLIGPVTDAVKTAENGTVPAGIASTPIQALPKLFSVPQAPVGPIIALCACLIAVLGVWAYSAWKARRGKV